MTKVVRVDDLPGMLVDMIKTDMVEVVHEQGVVQIRPLTVSEHSSQDPISKARGWLLRYPGLSVDEFLSRKRADESKEL